MIVRDDEVELVYEGNRIKRQQWFKTLADGTRIAWIPVHYIPDGKNQP